MKKNNHFVSMLIHIELKYYFNLYLYTVNWTSERRTDTAITTLKDQLIFFFCGKYFHKTLWKEKTLCWASTLTTTDDHSVANDRHYPFHTQILKADLIHYKSIDFYPTALKGCRGIVFTHGVQMDGWAGGGKKFFPNYISETVRCRKLIFGRDIG